MENIHPIFEKLLGTTQKEKLLGQRAIVVWLIGLSGSGKSTLARALENSLYKEGFHTALLDGDNLRTGVNNNLGFSSEDRVENIRRAAEVAKLIADNGTIAICSLITPTEEIRTMSRKILGEYYYEVFVECPLEVCERRDVKGLYKKARSGEIKDFTGIDSPFEDPANPDLVVDTDKLNEKESLDLLLSNILSKVRK